MSRVATILVAVSLGVLVAVGSAVVIVHADRHHTPVGAKTHLDATLASTALPPAKHVFVITIENEDYAKVWGPGSAAPYLAGTLRPKGVLLSSYYATAHNSLGNYTAQISGQGVSHQQQFDCQVFEDWAGTGVVAPGQYVGHGCVFPSATRTIAGQLDQAGLRWRGYMEDMGASCRHPALNTADTTQKARPGDEYATRHDPFMYFHAIIDRPAYCRSHVVDLSKLTVDLQQTATTRNLSYITPDLCSDGHDKPCVDGRPGGLQSVDSWMRTWVPRILASPAYKQDGVLVITSDESDGPNSDSSACCGEQAGPNAPLPGITGMGGGRIGALVLSRWTHPGTTTGTPYNHYSLLASMEGLFGLPRLGFASPSGVNRFGHDVFSAYPAG